MKDFYGNTIEAGVRVAFNLSGEVRLGFVNGFAPSKRYYMENPYILVQEVGGFKVSKVTRPGILSCYDERFLLRQTSQLLRFHLHRHLLVQRVAGATGIWGIV